MPWLVLVSYWLSVSTVHPSSHLGIMRFKRKIVIKLVGYSRSIRAQKERRDERWGGGRGGEQQRINAARNNNLIKYFAIWWVLKVSTSPGAEFQFRASTFRTFSFFCFACFSASMLMPLFATLGDLLRLLVFGRLKCITSCGYFFPLACALLTHFCFFILYTSSSCAFFLLTCSC